MQREKDKFSGYEKFIIILLTFLQFTVMLNFMVISPIGVILLSEMNITTNQFSLIVSVYAFSAAVSGLVIAGIADRFDRKRLLLVVYGGFIIGTLMCALVSDYTAFLIARCITGIFGGVIGAISMAIVADIFPLKSRGTVMGYLASAQAAATVLGIPIGLYLANNYGWHIPFYCITVVCIIVGVFAAVKLRPMTAHLGMDKTLNPLKQVIRIAIKPQHMNGFAAIMLIAIGAFMLQPFASVFAVSNLGVSMQVLPFVYVISGLAAMIIGPVLGYLSDL